MTIAVATVLLNELAERVDSVADALTALFNRPVAPVRLRLVAEPVVPVIRVVS